MMRNTNEMMTNGTSLGNTRGVALYTALCMLAIFSVLGTSFIHYMRLELKNTKYEISQVRAHQLSGGGIYAAIGELELAITEQKAVEKAYTFELNAYKYNRKGERSSFAQKVYVGVEDESGKVNLNNAPNDVLVALGLPETKVIEIKKQVTQRPLVSVDDLRVRDFIETPVYNTLIAKNSLTVYGDGTINLNAASSDVLAAVFALTPEEATALAAKRPFTSWEDTLAKVAKDSWSFNVPTRVPEGAQTPAGLSLHSTCFRLFSSVDLVMTINELARTTPSQTEAVVIIDTGGKSAIYFWTETSAISKVIEQIEILEEEAIDASASEEDAEETKEAI